MELNELRKTTEAAIVDEPWAIWRDLDHQGFYTVGDAGTYAEVLDGGIAEEAYPVAHVYTEDLAEFIATFDPPTVLALLSRLEQAEQAVARVREAANEAKMQEIHMQWISPKEILEILDGDTRVDV